MRKKNGFVLFETLVVVLLLTVSLMSLYTAFSAAMIRIRERNTSDTIDSVYKIYFVKDLLDSNYVNSRSEVDYDDSFLFYVNQRRAVDATRGNSDTICKQYDYGDGNKMYVCNYAPFEASTGEANYADDALYNAVRTYQIDKIYYVNYKFLNDSPKSNELYNKFDASSIDYIKQKSPDDGNFIVIKVKKQYYSPTSIYTDDDLDSAISPDFKIEFEYYHSSVALGTVTKAVSASPLLLYDGNGENQKESPVTTPGSYVNGAQYLLTSSHEFTTHPGQVIVGWTTDSTGSRVNNPETLSQCINDFDKFKEQGIECYAINSTMTISSTNRSLYAIWCGDGTLSGSVKCQSDSYVGDSNDGTGAHIRTSDSDPGAKISFGDKSGTIVYEGAGENNYIVLGTQCYNLMSNFDSTTGIKAIYAGFYDKTAKECVFDQTSTSINGNVEYKFSDHKYNSHAWMYKNTVDIFEIGNADELALQLGLHQYYHYLVETKNNITDFGSYGYFGNSVKWDGKQYTLLDALGKEVSEKILFHGYKTANYDNIKANNLGKYICYGGNATKCSEVYYVNNIIAFTPEGEKKAQDHIEIFGYKNGLDHTNYLKSSIAIGTDVSYDNSTKEYTILNASENVTLDDIYNKSKMETTFNRTTYLKGRHYMCENPSVRSDHVYKCKNARYVLSFAGTGAYIPLKHGMKSFEDFDNYVETDLENNANNRDSSIKKVVDKFYENYVKAYQDKLDMNVTFCNLSKKLPKLGNNSRPSYAYSTGIRDAGTDYFLYFYGYTERNIGDCMQDTFGNRYVYSVDKKVGNGLLKYPIGLITKDEAMYMGLKKNTTSKKSFLFYAGHTMTASLYATKPASEKHRPAYGGFVISNDKISTMGFDTEDDVLYNVRPVISIKIDNTIVGGDGSKSNPFMLE